MASKLPGPLAPGAVRARKPVSVGTRPCTGAKRMIVTDLTIVNDFTVDITVSAGEVDLYLRWASDLLAPEKDDDNGDG